MIRTVDLRLSPAAANDPAVVRDAALDATGWAADTTAESTIEVRVVKRSIDARGRAVVMQVRALVSHGEPLPPLLPPSRLHAAPGALPNVAGRTVVVIVGAGPAGLFAALACIARGGCPVVIERGKDVRARRHDLAALTQRHLVDPDSNYCFGEGGAGTFSDGKLYTRSGKRGDISEILETFVAFGASPDILVDAHPHIGTNKLPEIITRMRESIREAGGHVRFGERMSGLVVSDGKVGAVRLASGEEVAASRVILATGHSARDVFELLARQGVTIERKDFALGVRVEHPQSIIDAIRYHQPVRDPYLPPASYSAVEQIDGLGVYAFCMCPGGIIAPCATAPGEVVTNGWSPSKRNNPFANSGVVVEVRAPTGTSGESDPLAGMRYQQQIERAAWEAGGKTQSAPAQRLTDFCEGKLSSTLPGCSYPPGVTSQRVDQLLPPEIASRLQGGLRAFGRTMKGYYTKEALVVAVESRTSSPVRIPRDPVTLEHVTVRGLYPCGEGAGYAGGIVSAAMDGIRCAEKACEGLSGLGD